MVNPKLRSYKKVVPAVLYHRRTKVPESWDKVLGNANYSILFSGRTGCLSDGTLIQTSEGPKKITDCLGLPFSVMSYNFGRRQREYKPAIVVESGKKKLFRCILGDDKEIICSEDHKFFVSKKTKIIGAINNLKVFELPLKKISVGDKLIGLPNKVFSFLLPGSIKEYEVKSIEPHRPGQAYDLKVADNHNFFLANGVLTHNSGKDSVTTYVMNKDSELGRTPIVLDTKMEYPCAIFCQQDVVLRNLLLKHRLVGRGYKVVLWLPFIEGLDQNNHFQELLRYHHPNLEIRPFRIQIQNLVSKDSYNMALAKTQLQSAADKNTLSGTSRQLNEVKEEIGRSMGFDDHDLQSPGCGWEYLDFEEMTTNKKVNVVATYFMSKDSVMTTSYMMGVLNDLIVIGKSINRIRHPSELFTIIIPEVEIILPKNVRSLEQIVNTLRFSMRMGLKLMRSFGVRFRMNLQNLSSLDPDMVSQCVPFAGRTWNPKDLNLLGIFGLSKQERLLISRSSVGEFRQVIRRQDFSVVPFSHKAREMEYFVVMMRQFSADPSIYLFETENYFLSEIVDYPLIFWDAKPLSVPEYNRRVRAWIRSQEPRSVRPIDRAQYEKTEHFEEAVEALAEVPS